MSVANDQEAARIIGSTNREGYETRQNIWVVIEDIKIIAANIKEYTFSVEIPARIDFKAGQFVNYEQEFLYNEYFEELKRLAVNLIILKWQLMMITGM